MFDEDVYRKAMMQFISYLRTITSQKNIAFFSDCSREYIRNLGKGENIPSIRHFFNIIEATHIDLSEGTNLFIQMLREQQEIKKAEVHKRRAIQNYLSKNR